MKVSGAAALAVPGHRWSCCGVSGSAPDSPAVSPPTAGQLATQLAYDGGPQGCPGEGQSADRDHPDGEVDAGASLLGPVHVLEVQQQCGFVGDQSRRRTEGQCGRRVPVVLLLAANGDRPDAGQQRDAEVVMMEVLPPKLIPPPAGP